MPDDNETGDVTAVVKEIVYDDVEEFLHDATVSSKKEGEVFVGVGGTYYVRPFIDYEKVYDMLRNNYLTEHIERLRSLLFIDRPAITVLNPAGEEDVELSLHVQKMCDMPMVKLWSAMQTAWIDIQGWGCALFNPVWKKDGSEIILSALRRLPPESFGPESMTPAGVEPFNYSEILRGIYLDKDGETIHFIQTNTAGKADELHNVILLKDPTSTELAGTSKMVPIIPILSMLDFAWQAEIQKVNRTGAPILFIRFPPAEGGPIFIEGERDDLAYAQKILTNWGKNTAYTIRENMEIVTLNITDNQSAIETIDKLEARLRQYFMPSTLIQREGNTIGDSGDSQIKLLHEWLKGQHNWIEGMFEDMLEPWIVYNVYDDFSIDINIPEPKADDTEVNLKLAEMGNATGALTTNEIRKLLGREELDDAGLAELRDDRAAANPAPEFPGLFKDGHGPPKGVPLPGHGPGEIDDEEPKHEGWLTHLDPDEADPLLEADIKAGAVDAEKAAMVTYAKALEDAKQGKI